MPELKSLAFRVTVTSELFQPAGFGSGATSAVTVGGLLSICTVTVIWLALPARSTAVPKRLLAPWAVTVTGSEQKSIPLPVSWQSKVTVTGPLFQPFPFGAESMIALIVGGVESEMKFTVMLDELAFPATSVA